MHGCSSAAPRIGQEVYLYYSIGSSDTWIEVIKCYIPYKVGEYESWKSYSAYIPQLAKQSSVKFKWE